MKSIWAQIWEVTWGHYQCLALPRIRLLARTQPGLDFPPRPLIPAQHCGVPTREPWDETAFKAIFFFVVLLLLFSFELTKSGWVCELTPVASPRLLMSGKGPQPSHGAASGRLRTTANAETAIAPPWWFMLNSNSGLSKFEGRLLNLLYWLILPYGVKKIPS